MRPSIRHIGEKLKALLAEDAVFYSVLLVLVAVVSFGLGRQSVVNSELPAKENRPIVENQTSITQLKPLERPEISESATKITVMASKSGTKYHLPTCPGAKQIKETNIITFDSIAAAEAAGYTPAANCPGLQ